MGKVIFWIVVIFGILLVARLANVAATKRRKGGSPGVPPAHPMVRCMRCGTFLPGADAKAVPGGHVCGDPGCTVRR
jgi:hypothetical protein